MLEAKSCQARRAGIAKQAILGAILLLFFASATRLAAQTASSGTVLGTVTDSSGGVIPQVEVDLTNIATGITTKQSTNNRGQYLFPQVAPGNYTITFKKSGFRAASLQNATVEVNKSFTANMAMQVGEVTQTVEVQATAQQELQTTDAQVGDVVSGSELEHLPTLTRNALELAQLQPTAAPGSGATGGGFSGARSDQNTITLDGLDVTDNIIGEGFGQQEPLSIENVQEFRIGVTNSNSTFDRSPGGQTTLISRSGSNAFHGDAYWYHQNSEFNANTWDSNRTGIPLPRLLDNRAGVSVGGPFIKNKTFFYSNYEIHRFPNNALESVVVPTPSLKSGTLTFKDSTGTPVAYNLSSSTPQCGATGTSLCDPRQLGISPAVSALWALLPNPVPGKTLNPNLGDGLNTVGFQSILSLPIKDDDVSFRLDHNFTDKIRFYGRYFYNRDLAPQSVLDITNGNIKSLANEPNRNDAEAAGLDYQFTPNLSNSFRFLHQRKRLGLVSTSGETSAQALAASSPAIASATATNVSGVLAALQIAGTGNQALGSLQPLENDAQNSRSQIFQGITKEFTDNLTWSKGTHGISAGGTVFFLPFILNHTDKVTSTTSPSAFLNTGGPNNFQIPAANTPPACGGAITTNCLNPSDVARWGQFYTAALGIIGNVNFVGARDGSLQPEPLLTPLLSNTTERAYNFYAQDTWRFRPSLTLTYGLSYGWQTPTKEAQGLQTLVADHTAGDSTINTVNYINMKAAAAQQGNIFNPTLSFVPIRSSSRSNLFNTDYGDWAPRASLAWNPSYSSGLLGRMLGSNKTVIRGGFGISYDRTAIVSDILQAFLGVGFSDIFTNVSPACTTGPGCGGGSVSTNPGLNSFRVGQDGAIQLPSITPLTSPIVPSPFADQLGLTTDAFNYKVGRNYQFDLTVQREIPGNAIVEIGYVGRLGRNLPTAYDLDASAYFFKDATSGGPFPAGQTFAQAFDSVGCVLRGETGQTIRGFTCPAALTPQPFFENQIGAGATTLLASIDPASFINGSAFGIFLDSELIGGPDYNNLQIFAANLLQVGKGFSNYNGMFISVHKRPTHGLTFNVNYTYSKSLDQVGFIQNNIPSILTPYNTSLTYGPSLFDRRNVFNATYDYELPFGSGRRFSSSRGILNKLIGGFYTAGVFTAAAGLPDLGDQGADYGSLPINFDAADIQTASISTGVHRGVAGSGGVGTNGDPASGGSGINIFSNPQAAAQSFRVPLLSVDGRAGEANPFYGFGYWNFDLRLGKSTTLGEGIKMDLSADAFNLFNNVNFADPSFSLTNLPSFGVVTGTQTLTNRNQSSRYLQLGLRLEF